MLRRVTSLMVAGNPPHDALARLANGTGKHREPWGVSDHPLNPAIGAAEEAKGTPRRISLRRKRYLAERHRMTNSNVGKVVCGDLNRCGRRAAVWVDNQISAAKHRYN